MKLILRLVAVCAIAIGLGFGVVACGDDDDSGSTTAAAPVAETTLTSSPSADLRVTLDRLLGEHAALAIIAMQKGVDGAPDFDQTAAALEANTVDLGDAIGSVYGDEARDAFLELWRAHIGFFVDYTVATAGDDEAGRQQALQALDGYRQGFSNFLAEANPNLEAGPLADGLQNHVDQLTAALDQYEAGNYEEAYASLREAYAHMFGTGDALSGAISQQFPENFGG